MDKHEIATIDDETQIDNDQPLLQKKSKIFPAQKLDGLTKISAFGYSIGHFQNDLTVACWFNYTLYFIQNIVFADLNTHSEAGHGSKAGKYAGLVLLFGQVADGLATPIVGAFSDRFNTRLGKRTPWYIFGFILGTISFIFIFQESLIKTLTGNNSEEARLLNYIIFASLYNIGWAAVQVPHMALVPSLTLSRNVREELNNRRNTFTYVANLYVLIFAFGIFQMLPGQAERQFKIIAFSSAGLGVLSSLFFLATVNERKLTQDCRRIKRQIKNQYHISVEQKRSSRNKKPEDGSESPGESLSPWEFSDAEEPNKIHLSETRRRSISSSGGGDEDTVHWTHWFTKGSFYLCGFVYMGVRMLVNVQSSLMIYYLQNVLKLASKDEIREGGFTFAFAVIPMIIYIASTLTSIKLKVFYDAFGRKTTFSIGAIATFIGVFVRMYLEHKTSHFMYPLAVIIGVGQSICLNAGISLIGDVVGSKGGSGAVVFGIYGFLDKIANGIVLYFAADIKDLSDAHNEGYVRITASLIPGIATLVAWILVLAGKSSDDESDVVIDHKPKYAKFKNKRNSKHKRDLNISLQQVQEVQEVL